MNKDVKKANQLALKIILLIVVVGVIDILLLMCIPYLGTHQRIVMAPSTFLLACMIAYWKLKAKREEEENE